MDASISGYENTILAGQIQENYFTPALNLIILLLIVFLIISLAAIIKGAFSHYTASDNEDKIAVAERLMYKGAIFLAVIIAVSVFGHYIIKNNQSVSANNAVNYGVNIGQ